MNDWFKKKKITAIAITSVCGVAVCFIIAAMLWTIFTTADEDYNESLGANWEIVLPPESSYTEVYEADSGVSFFGDGLRYHIFSYENDYSIGQMLIWREEQDRTRRYDSYSSAVNSWLGELNVSDDKFPDCDECVFWYQTSYDESEIILLWNKNEKKIYTVESFD